MNGPQHYAEADRLLDDAARLVREAGDRDRERGVDDGRTPNLDAMLEVTSHLVARAQAHAALAHVALLAATAPIRGGQLGPGLMPEESVAWDAVIES